jgi:hypothetical protein
MKFLKLFEQYNSKLNSQFWNWFGDSVVNKNGEPIVCYHGSINKIEVFDYSKSIGDYGQGNYFTPDESIARQHGDNIHGCYLRLINPYEIEDRYMMNQIWDSFLDMKETGEINESETIRSYLMSKGCDGIIVNNPNEMTQSPYYVVFDANQIKSINNDGTWDITDENIHS